MLVLSQATGSPFLLLSVFLLEAHWESMRVAQAGALLEPWEYGPQFRLDGKLISLAETYYFT